MGYDDTKVVEAHNFVRAISGEAAELATLDDAVASASVLDAMVGLARDRTVGIAMSKDAGFSVDTGPELPTRRIGVIGCGRIGRMHAGDARPSGTWEAVARSGLRHRLAARVGRRGLESACGRRQSVERGARRSGGDVDAVAICTSTDTHADLIVAAAAAGKAIFCEKPVSLDLGEVDRALAAVGPAGVPFMVGFNRRFDAAHRSVRDAVADGRSARCTCCGSPAGTRRRRRSSTSRCPAGSSST